MTIGLETLERDTLEKIRLKYEREGYKFIVEPQPKDIPAFLEGFIPDAIAVGADENVIIEVKSTRGSADSSAAARFLANEVPKHPGWRFDLVIAEIMDRHGDTHAEPDKRQLHAELDSLKVLRRAAGDKVALVIAWGLLEAVTRRLYLNQQAGEPKRYLPTTIVETLVSEGIVDDEDRLLRLAKSRNQLVHGFTGIEVEETDMQFLIGVMEELLPRLRK
jgi:hypothetical protein